MLIRQIRNATMIITSGKHRVLVDPMLSPKGALPPYRWLTRRRRRNPIVDLPEGTEGYLAEVTHALITHCRRGHVDHLDRSAIRFLREKQTPVYCSENDAAFLEKRGLKVLVLRKNCENDFLNGKITLIPCRHGGWFISTLIGNGVGFIIQLPGEPSLYIAGDTVLTRRVRGAIEDFAPDWLVLPAGAARLDVGNPVLMSLDEIHQAVEMAQGKVILNHLEALDHCPVTRDEARRFLASKGLSGKVIIPENGEMVNSHTDIGC